MKLKYDKLLVIFAFRINLRHYSLVTESTTNDEPNVCLELEVGARQVRFGRGLKPIELEYVAGEINSFIDELS